MGKRKMVKDKNEEEEEVVDDGKKFFACYLLTSLSPRFKGHTYIGYTVNPRRRIRQHNGEIGCGAWRTKKKRPWEMVLCIYGFPTNVAALQFEWAWQHPFESLAVRSAAATFKSISGLANKVKLAFTMLTLPAWESLNLTVNFFSTKYQNNASACPPLPKQMKIRICSMDDLACYNDDYVSNDEGEGEEECDTNIGLQEPIGEVSAEAIEMVHNRDNSDERLTEINPRWPMNSSPRRLDRNRSLNINDSPAKTFSSFASSYIVDDVGTSTSGEQFVADFKEDQVLMANGGVNGRQIEIIDLFTPSPCYVIKPGSKKRRPATALCSEIIDLTNSPVFV